MNANNLIHRVTWSPASLSEEPLSFTRVVFLTGDEEPDEIMSMYRKQLNDEGYETEVVRDPMEIISHLACDVIVVHIPHAAKAKDEIYEAVTKSCTNLITAAKALCQYHQLDKRKTHKLFSLIKKDLGIRDLGYAPLYGLARVIKMEIPELFGGLFEDDKIGFPLLPIKYAQGFDVVRVCNGVAQTASLQPFQDLSNDRKMPQLNPQGTYLITGGTGGLGLEVAIWMRMRGARSILLVSRSGLPSAPSGEPRDANIDRLVSRITELEAIGATVHVLAIDLSKPDADSTLREAIDNLKIPPIKGVVHAAGIAGFDTLKRCTTSDIANVLAPKVVGGLILDKIFPPGTLDFFTLVSSIGQLVGSPGQLTYAPANAFLDGLAAQRRREGDNSVSIQWTCWRNVGMVSQSRSSTRTVNRGLKIRGIADICKEEAFEAWDRITSLKTDHAAVVRVLELDENEPLRHPILKHITPRKKEKRKVTLTSYNNYPENAVAVVGMACRTAAGDTAEDLWEAIQTGRTTEREIDSKRFPDAVMKDKMWGNFLSNIDSFDHQFFKKSRREAMALDPHQRTILETTYHALESANCFGGGQKQEAETHERTQNKDTTGCFIGMIAPDYSLNLASHPASPYTGIGMHRSYVAGRLSHHFGWTGPSQTIDTACSSSMVAIHQACRSIQTGECTRAVAGGVNLITNLVLYDALRVGGFISKTGGCKAFDAGADGYCRGEAVGVVVLKSLNKALKDGDDIQGVLLATSNNQNMNHTSITNPVLESQTALYRDVLARAGVNPEDISYVEAHGTGTRAGDPIEIKSIRQVLGGKDRHSILQIGSVKSNIGHAEGASGIVSLIKVLLMMKHGKIPIQAQFRTLNTNIPALETDKMAISTSLQKQWSDDLRLALVNNFGASGSNASVVVAPPPPRSSSSSTLSIDRAISTASISALPFFISAASRASLLTYCNKLKTQIGEGSLSSESTPNLAFNLATKQNRQLQHVYCTTATSLTDLQAQLGDFEEHTMTSKKPKPIVLLFGGQNGNTVPSAKHFYDSSLLFQTHLHKCDDVIRSLDLPSLFPVVLQGIQGDSDLVLRHAAMFSIQYSCGMSWIDSGVKPQVICGHSFGEWTALTVSGAMTLKDGMRLITGTVQDHRMILSIQLLQKTDILAGRASIIQKSWGNDTGSMIAIEAPLTSTNTTPNKHLETFYEKHPDIKLDIACYNGPNQYVVAGRTINMELLELHLQDKIASGEKLSFKVLKDVHAYHSAMADSIVGECAKLSSEISFQKPTLPFESCHQSLWTGPGSNIIARHTRSPVYFGRTISRVASRLGPCIFLEAGFGSPIINMTRNALSQAHPLAEHSYVAINGKDLVRSLADATVTLWKNGQQQVQFWLFHRSQRMSYESIAIPPYQFEKDRHWLDYIDPLADKKNKPDEHSANLTGECPHCLKNINDFPYIVQDKSQIQPVDRFVFKVDTRSKRYQELVGGHSVTGSPICPASMYLELFSHAVVLVYRPQVMTTNSEITIDSLEIRAALGLDTQRLVKVILTKKTEKSWNFELSSTKNNEKPVSHATGNISLRERNGRIIDEQAEKNMWRHITSLLDEGTDDIEAVRGSMVYKIFGKMVKYSSIYRGLRHLAGRDSEGAGEVSMPKEDLDTMARTPNDTISDPLILDNFIQVPGAFMNSICEDEDEVDSGASFVCTGIETVRPLNSIQGEGKYRVYTKIVMDNNKETVLDLFAFDKQSRKIVFSAQGIKFSRLPRNKLAKMLARANPGINSKEESPGFSKAAASTTAPKSSSQTIINGHTNTYKKDRIDVVDILSGVQKILSISLEVPVRMVTKQATLDELGADSLVSSEIQAKISEKFKIDISTGDFEQLIDIASLCDLISSRISGEVSDASSNNFENQNPVSIIEKADNTNSDWQKTVFEILSQSLDVSVAEIEMDSILDDLGADSLVATEIVSNLNEAFSLDIQTAEFASIVDVASIFSLIPGASDVDSIQTPMNTPPKSSRASPTPDSGSSAAPYTGIDLIENNEGTTSTNYNAASVHAAFKEIRHGFDIHAKTTNYLGYWDKVYPEQLKTVAAFIIEAFEKLGCPIRHFRHGEKLPAVALTLNKYKRDILRLWEILEEAGVVEKIGDEFACGPAAKDYDNKAMSAEYLSKKIIAEFSHYLPINNIISLIGPQLAGYLTGKVNPISILYGDDKGRSLLDDFYFTTPDVQAASRLLSDFISAIIRARISENEPLHILEVGAGTGGTTKHLIPFLQATGIPFTYTFTDLSRYLVTRAMKTTFKDIENMKFMELNIEETPPEELLGLHHIVVSTNCVHATRNLRYSLSNIHKLLRPNIGCVVLLERTQKLAWFDIVFGLLDGRWLLDNGRQYAMQSAWAWERDMQAAGFAHVDWSDGITRESRSFRVICGMLADTEDPCPAKTTSILLHRAISTWKNRNLFLVPGGFGFGAVFRGLSPSLVVVKNVSVYALDSPFTIIKPDPKQPPTIEELAAIYVAEIKRKQPEGPYLIGGYSMGGVVAYEIVRQLLEDDSEVEKLFMIDTACPTFSASLPKALVDFLDSIIEVRATNPGEIKDKRIGKNDHSTLGNQQLTRYKVSKLPGKKIPSAVLFLAREGLDKQKKIPRPEVSPEEQRTMDWFLNDRLGDESLGWEELLEDVTVIPAEGNHFSMMKRALISDWGVKLAEILSAI
ncbi:hypothetical protein ACHAP3_003343 [Botrytis cinerea]